MTDREVMQMALDALVSSTGELHLHLASPTDMQLVKNHKAIKALRTALTQPEAYPDNFIDALKYHTAINEQPEPVAWCIVENGRVHGLVKTKPAVMNAEKWQPLYTAPPKKEWVGLTHTELEDCILISEWATWIEVGRAIEQALKENNNG